MGELVPHGLPPQEHRGCRSRALRMEMRCQICTCMPGLCRCAHESESSPHNHGAHRLEWHLPGRRGRPRLGRKWRDGLSG